MKHGMDKVPDKPSIGILTFAVSIAGNVPLSNLINVLSPVSKDIILIAGNSSYDFFKDNKRIKVYGIIHKSYKNPIIRIANYIYKQLLLSYKVATLSKGIDKWIFFFNTDTMILPSMTLKLLGKKVILALPSSSSMIHMYSNKYNYTAINILSKIGYMLSTNIIVYSPNLIKEWGLEKFEKKIRISHEHYIDFEKFTMKKPVSEREDIIGYIGRLDEEKGIANFIESIPEIAKQLKSYKFLVVGEGHLSEEMKKRIHDAGLDNKVLFRGWVEHDKLPDCYNRIKLMVIPSYTEGLPNTMLEAMACGTPVLAMPVGAIPDIIKEGITGYLLEDNMPDTIANRAIAITVDKDIEKVSRNGFEFVQDEFSYKATSHRYASVLEKL